MSFRGKKAGDDIGCDDHVLTRETPCPLKLFVCTLALTTLACSCLVREGTVSPIVGVPVATAIPDEDIGQAREWILSRISGRLEEVLEEKTVHLTADRALRVYSKTWDEKTPHVTLYFSDYAVRLPIQDIEGYPWDSVVEQAETGHLGPVQLRNGWGIWLGHVERKDAISHDLSLSVRGTCSQLVLSADARRKQAVRRLCADFEKQFVFSNDLELLRRLWRSPFEVKDPSTISSAEALATLFLADLKRMLAHPAAEEHVAEILTPAMAGFEFGDGTSHAGFSAELFDERNHMSVLFLPPESLGEPLDEDFRRRVLASVRRHGRWAPGLDMIREAERVLQLQDTDHSKEIGTLLLFSALQFPDHKTRAARMLVKLYPSDNSQREEIIEIVNFIIQGR